MIIHNKIIKEVQMKVYLIINNIQVVNNKLMRNKSTEGI